MSLDPEQIANPKYWRDKAEETRVIAEQMRDSDAIKAMQAAANHFDNLAKIAEGMRRALAAINAQPFPAAPPESSVGHPTDQN